MKKIPTVKYTRIVGYVRPVTLWNKGKKAEWSKRSIINARNLCGKAQNK